MPLSEPGEFSSDTPWEAIQLDTKFAMLEAQTGYASHLEPMAE